VVQTPGIVPSQREYQVQGKSYLPTLRFGRLLYISMEKPTLFFLIFILAALAYYFGRNRSVALVAGQSARLHSLPSYYGSYTALWFLFPAITLILLWAAFESPVLTHTLVSGLPSAMASAPEDKLGLFLNDVRNYVISDIQAILSFEFIVLNY
jgi:hypothetical protein